VPRQEQLWADYLAELQSRQIPRPAESVVKLMLAQGLLVLERIF
jgi:hypothetical protein